VGVDSTICSFEPFGVNPRVRPSVVQTVKDGTFGGCLFGWGRIDEIHVSAETDKSVGPRCFPDFEDSGQSLDTDCRFVPLLQPNPRKPTQKNTQPIQQ
jgi:hypothetical protein